MYRRQRIELVDPVVQEWFQVNAPESATAEDGVLFASVICGELPDGTPEQKIARARELLLTHYQGA